MSVKKTIKESRDLSTIGGEKIPHQKQNNYTRNGNENENDDISMLCQRERIVGNRKYFIIHHLLPVAFFIVTSIFIFRKIIFADGVIVNGDLTRPAELERFSQFFYPLWSDYESISVIARLPQLLFYLPFIGIGYLFNMDTTEVLVLVFISIFFLSGIFMYYSSKCLLTRSYDEKNITILIASISSGLAYMWSTFVIYQVYHPLILAAFAFAPLLIITFITGIERKKIRYIILTGFLWCLMCGAVHWVVYGAILLFGYLLFSFISDNTSHIIDKKYQVIKKSISSHIKYLLILLFSFICFSAYWIIPGYLMGGTSRYSKTIGIETFEFWYSGSSFKEAISMHSSRFISSETFSPRPELLDSTPMGSILTILGVGVFLFAITALIFNHKNRYVRFFSIFSLISIFLTVCFNVIPEFGQWLVLEAPLHNLYGWAFKTPKISQFIILSVSLLLGFGVFEIIDRIMKCKFKRKNVNIGISTLIIAVLFLSVILPHWPLATGDMNGALTPSEIPEEFLKVNSWLREQDGDYKVLWIPKYRGRGVDWNEGHRTTKDIAGLLSSRPTYVFDSNQNQPNGYGIYYLTSILSDLYANSLLLDNRTNDLGKCLAPQGIKYVIFHDDNATPSGKSDILLNNLKFQEDLVLIKKIGFIYVFLNQCLDDAANSRFFIPSKNFMVSGGLSSLATLNSIPHFNPRTDGLIFGDQQQYDRDELDKMVDDVILTGSTSIDEMIFPLVDEKYFISPFDHTNRLLPSKTWSKYKLEDLPPSVRRRGRMDSWDWAYDEDLVCTWSSGVIQDDDKDAEAQPIQHYDFETGFDGFKINSSNLSLHSSNDSVNGKKSMNGILIKGDPAEMHIASTEEIPLPPGGGHFRITMYIRAENAFNVQVVLNFFDENKEFIRHAFIDTDSGNFDYKRIEKDFTVRSNEVYYSIQIQANQHPYAEANWWVDDINIYDLKSMTVPNRLEMDFDLRRSDDYVLFIRSLRGEKGGRIDIHLDGKFSNYVDTIGNSNAFTWQMIDSFYLKKGSHTLAMDNKNGFNAVNLLAIIPKQKLREYRGDVENFLRNKGLIYALEAESNLEFEEANVMDSHGSCASSGKVLNLSENSKARLPVDIIKSGHYSLSMRMIVGSGNNKFEILNGNNSYDFECNPEDEGDFSWINVNGIYLAKGPTEFSFISSTGGNNVLNRSFEDGGGDINNTPIQLGLLQEMNNEIDLVVLHLEENGKSLEDVFESPPSAMIFDYKKIDTTKYEIRISSTGPFLLAFAEAYDEYWVAHIKGSTKIESIPLNGMINGFLIEKTGNFTIIIEFEPQKWFYIGAGITVASIVVSLGSLICVDRKLWGKRFLILSNILSRLSRNIVWNRDKMR